MSTESKRKSNGVAAAALAVVLGLGSGGASIEAAGGGAPSPWIGWRPDLTITSHTFLTIGTTRYLGINVVNAGFLPAGPFKIGVISVVGSFDISVAGLAPGASKLLWIVVNPAAPSGSPYFFAVDAYFQVAESNEGNNLYTVTIP